MQRNFTADRVDAVWLTDITEHPTLEGKVYVCAIKDVFSNRIVGYALDERMTAQLAVAALRAAIARRQPRGTVVVHSDRGSQFRSRAFRAVLNRHRWRTRDELRYAIITRIEHTYNRRRRQRVLGKLTPVEFETTPHQQTA